MKQQSRDIYRAYVLENRSVDEIVASFGVSADMYFIAGAIITQRRKRGPCRAEMPRIAKTYAETLKANPDIELIHFSRDQNDEKALAWAKEHDVLFPVVKPKGGNPLNLQSRGIPHLFIVKADGTLVEEGHPAKLFCEEKLRALK